MCLNDRLFLDDEGRVVFSESTQIYFIPLTSNLSMENLNYLSYYEDWKVYVNDTFGSFRIGVS